MKIVGIRILLVLSLLLGFGGPSSVSAATINETLSVNIPIEQWAGHSFTFLALPADKQGTGYDIFKVDPANKNFEGNPALRISYQEYVGKQVMVDQVLTLPPSIDQKKYLVYMTVNETGEKLVGQATHEQLDGLVLTDDLANARKQFLGTTIYPKFRELAGLYIPRINETPMSVTLPIGSAATVVDVYSGNRAQEPIWLIVSINEQKAMLPISYSWTNMLTSEWTQTSPWKEDFFTEDPRSNFGWSQNTWTNIENGNVEIGMTKEQIRLSWGKAVHVDNKNNRWIYGPKKLIFSGEVLSSIETTN